jgi:pilus assembly protein CpaF
MIAETPLRSDPSRSFQQLKTRLRRRLVEAIDFTKAGQLGARELQAQVRALAAHLCEHEQLAADSADRERLAREIVDEIYGFGPLEPLMDDPTVSDILVNGADSVFVERAGLLEPTDIRFADNEHLREFIQRLAGRCGRRIDEASPMVDARLPDGSRLSAILPPLAVRGPKLSIRRFQAGILQFEDMIRAGMFTSEMGDFLAAVVRGRMNLLLSGGSGVGKTTLLNNLSWFISESERVVTIEETAELQLQQPDVVSLELPPPNFSGRSEITQRDLLKQSFRLRPDRVIIGEVRGGEVFELLQAMHTGHAGSMSTIHADDVRQALDRLEVMAALSGAELPVDVVRRYIASAVQVLIHVSRLSSGQRKVTRISEMVAFHDGAYDIEDIFVYRQAAMESDEHAGGGFYATGYEPLCLRRLTAAGIDLPREMFVPREMTAGTVFARAPLPPVERGAGLLQ